MVKKQQRRRSVIEKQRQLLLLAATGARKPSELSKNADEKKMAHALARYVSIKSTAYDASFDKKIRKIRPEWFMSTADRLKTALLMYAQSGYDKPSQNSDNPAEKKFGIALARFLNRTGACYDEEFEDKIRRKRPDWFAGKAAKTKTLLLAMARNGDARPSLKSYDKAEVSLARKLASYINRHSTVYDIFFSNKIQKMRPEWFRGNNDD